MSCELSFVALRKKLSLLCCYNYNFTMDSYCDEYFSCCHKTQLAHCYKSVLRSIAQGSYICRKFVNTVRQFCEN